MGYRENKNGAWVVTYLGGDGTGIASVHSHEIDALRAANGSGMIVKFWPDNTDISEAYVVQIDEGD